ncbi:uncharacterized protein B4U80_08167 [Leptotrombidium deliense]|uniref:FYVE-type zinc finger domain-containing protein n=1 Tax=Leptotrombidium deliense TaxID=299467 RepID=A0A443SQ01_9ACAR|nr:uncharacterized protein B4U80_08167 [Leptotrombidium deliense]
MLDVSNLKAEIQRLRKRGIIKPGLDQSRVCARCLTELGRIINRGAFCPVCRKKVCKVCRVNGEDDKIWVCIVCHKQMQYKAVSGEWMREFTRSASEKIRSPSSKAFASAKETIGGFYSQSNSSEECDLKKQLDSTNESNVDVKPRRGLPPKLPTIDNSFQRQSPPASAGSSGGSQENSPKPPLSPVLKVYQQAVDLMSGDRKNVPLPEKEMVYRKIYVTTEKKFTPKREKEPLQKKASSRLQESSSSSEDEVDSQHTSLGATKSSESTPSPRTPNSYKILSGIANNQATAFQFPPSPLYSRPSSHERQSSDEFSTTVSSLRSRSTSSETNDDSAGLAPQPLPRSRRISPLRKQQAIAEELSNEPISRNSYTTTEYPQTSGADSGVSDCNSAMSPKLFEGRTLKDEEFTIKKCPSEESESSLNDDEGTVEKTTGYLFRKVTVKRRNFQNDGHNHESAGETLRSSKGDQQRNVVQKSKSEGKLNRTCICYLADRQSHLNHRHCECNSASVSVQRT